MTTRNFFYWVVAANLLVISLAVILKSTHTLDLFKEGSFVTVFSALQLLAIARIAQLIFRERDAGRTISVWKSASLIWALIAVGFVFLAADESLKIHEKLDKLIHDVFNIEETGLTDRIDDVLVGLYGLIGIAVLLIYRKELMACQARYVWFVAGFIMMFSMVVLDIITNREDILLAWFDQDTGLSLHMWLSMLEEALKVFAEACFVLGFYTILQKLRTARTASPS